jgi:hypothetical protein
MLHDFDRDEHLNLLNPALFRVYAVDESNQSWWCRILSISPDGVTVRLRLTAPNSFPAPDFPESGFITITLTHPAFHDPKRIPISVDYVDDNGCW